MEQMFVAVLALPGILLAIFAGYQLFFMLVSLPSLFSRAQVDDGGVRTRFTVVIPAHNEELLIAETVRSLRASHYPAERLTIIVIADNCTDRTAAVARAEGALAYERNDPARPGKPYALNWLFSQIDLERSDAFCIIDADTVVAPDFLRIMDSRLRAGEEAIQGYFGVMNPDENWLTRLGVLPSVLKFRLHFPGKRALGFTCPLAGNGMCFSRDVIRKMGWQAFSLTENWEYYVMLVLAGYEPTAAPAARIYSQLARSLAQGQTQRMRWMKGRIETLQRYWRQLLRAGVQERSLAKLDVLMELARPSHSILLFWSVAYVLVCLIGWLLMYPAGGWLLVFSMAILGAQVAYFLAGLLVERPPLRTWLALPMVPLYVCWKLAVSARGLLGLRDCRWVKTTRHSTR